MGCCTRSEQATNSGFTRKKGCTDILFLFLFVAFLGGMGYSVYFCLTHGDPYKLVYGIDSWGNTCNRENEQVAGAPYSGLDLSDHEKLFYFNFAGAVAEAVDTVQICVTSCPNATMQNETALWDLRDESGIQLCRYDLNRDVYLNLSAAQRQPSQAMHALCPGTPVTPHVSMFHRCVPQSSIQAGTSIFDAAASAIASVTDGYIFNKCENSGSLLDHIANDIERTYLDVGKLACAALVLSLVMMVLLRFLAPIFVWVMVLGCALCVAGAAAYAWLKYFQFKGELEEIAETQRIGSEEDYVRKWLYGAIVLSVIAAIVQLLILIMRKRIALVVQLFREAGKAVGDVPGLMLLPLLTICFLCASLAALGYGFMFLLTSDTPIVANNTGVVTYQTDDLVFYMRWYYLFGIFWISEFVAACEIMVVACAVSIWYFTLDKRARFRMCRGGALRAGMRRLVCQHLGTVALGSFMIALVQFARTVLAYVQYQLKGKTSKLAQYLLKGLACCLWCLEKVLKFFTKNAYIMTAIYGCNLCSGGVKAASTLLRNILRVGALSSIGTFVLFLGKLCVVTPVFLLALYYFQNKPTICNLYVPLLVTALAAYVVADSFLGVYGITVDTLFLCFCVDCDENDGIVKPYFMSKGLMNFVSNSRETKQAAEKREKDALAEKRRVKTTTTKHGSNESNIEWSGSHITYP